MDTPKPCVSIDKVTGLVKEYPSIRSAAKAVGGQKDIVKEACDGKVKSAYGFFWEYAEV